MRALSPARGVPLVAAARQQRFHISLRYFVALVAALSLIQAAIGGDIVLIICCLISICAGLIPIWLFGIQSTIGVFFAILVFFFPVSALLIKTCLLQPIQSNLFAPDLSFQVMATGMVAAGAAAAVLYQCKRLLNYKPLFKPLSGSALTMLCFISAPVAILGMIGSQLPGGLGRASALTGGMIFLSLVAATQLALIRSNGRSGLSTLSVPLLLFCIFVSLASGSKQAAFATAICYFLPVYLYRGALKRSELLLVFVGTFALLFLISPAINISRGIRDSASSWELIQRTFATMADLWTGDLRGLADITNYNFDDNAYYIRYVSDTTTAIDRFVLVSYIDGLLRFASDRFLGYSALLNSLSGSIIPNLLDPGQKEVASSGDIFLQYLGVFDEASTSQITLPVFGEGYFIDGYLGVFIVAFLSFLLIGAALVFVFGDVRSNAFAMWWVGLNGFVMAAASATSLAFFAIRVLPLYIILYLVSARLPKKRRQIGKYDIRS
jgi:hypothetical protein